MYIIKLTKDINEIDIFLAPDERRKIKKFHPRCIISHC